MVCCILPFDKSLMFKVKTTTFGYFTSIHQILENSTIFEIYIFISRMIQSVRLRKKKQYLMIGSFFQKNYLCDVCKITRKSSYNCTKYFYLIHKSSQLLLDI